jgi:hypothetical protein
MADHDRRGATMGDSTKHTDKDNGKDVVTISYWGDEPRWCSEVTLGPTPHELGEFATLSMAMNAAMKFYYEQRPAARRRGAGKGG